MTGEKADKPRRENMRKPLIKPLRGSQVWSRFRWEKLLAEMCKQVPQLEEFDAEYWHFAAFSAEPAAEELAVLQRLLTYGPRSLHEQPGGETMLVVPRLGTISPWSSKATDIAHHCGLNKISRLERGISYRLNSDEGVLTEKQLSQAADLLHDRMTEVVLSDLDEAACLFSRAEPKPYIQVDVLGAASKASTSACSRKPMILRSWRLLGIAKTR